VNVYEPVSQRRRRTWNWLGHTPRKMEDGIAKQTVDIAKPQRKKEGDQGILEKRSRQRNMDNELGAQMEEDNNTNTELDGD